MIEVNTFNNGQPYVLHDLRWRRALRTPTSSATHRLREKLPLPASAITINTTFLLSWRYKATRYARDVARKIFQYGERQDASLVQRHAAASPSATSIRPDAFAPAWCPLYLSCESSADAESLDICGLYGWTRAVINILSR